MSLGEAIFTRASAHGLGGLLGTPPRLYPIDEVPQNVVGDPATDYAQYTVIDAPRVHVMSRDSLAQPRVQFDIVAATRKTAWAICEQLKTCFNRWTATAGGITVSASVIMDDGHDFEKDEATQRPGVSFDAEMTYQLA